MSIKKIGKNLLCNILERQVVGLRKNHPFTLVAVAGSVGKTSTKLAVAKTLAGSRKVRWQEGNYNDRLTVPLVIFGHDSPNVLDFFKWLKIIISNKKQIKNGLNYDVVVVELGTDGPGQLNEFAYLKPEIGVVCSVAPEHMEFFSDLDTVAAEELSLLEFCQTTLLGTDDVDAKYLKNTNSYLSYGLNNQPVYSAQLSPTANGINQRLNIYKNQKDLVSAEINLAGVQGGKVVLASVAVADQLGLNKEEIVAAIERIIPYAGRMNTLLGLKNSLLIDDTYNASPLAVKAGLDVLYNIEASQRIAILGNMNELGKASRVLHEQIGDYCRADKLDLVITIGPDANKYLAPRAEAVGCTVKSFDSPYDAGNYALTRLVDEAVIFAKGSQNQVFAEEALKPLLANPEDESKLVRQSDYWMKIKEGQFGHYDRGNVA